MTRSGLDFEYKQFHFVPCHPKLNEQIGLDCMGGNEAVL